MNIEEFIAELRRQNLSLYLEGDNIRVVGPGDCLRPELRTKIVSCKQEIISFLRTPIAAAETKRVSQSLVAVRPNGSKPPIFAIPGLEGYSPEWELLARQFSGDQPMYALESIGLNGQTTPLDRVESIAAHFVAETRKVRAAGPYCLLASCGGGSIAFEMAQQLHAASEMVKLAFLESWPPHFTVLYQPGHPVAKANFEALISYVPRHYPGSLLLLIAEERPIPGKDPRLWWAAQAERCEILRLPGRDLPEMFQNVAMIAAHLCRYFSAADGSTSLRAVPDAV